ncbi:MAG TPA: NlpC/P60 family protein, partial [Gaiellaceae bacterium]|nr:NlpC/P60 family protein [Gaiellaceae bacterium]
MSRRAVFAFLFVLSGVLAWTLGAGAGGRDWAAPEIRAVTQAGVLGSSPATFAPESPLTQRALSSAIAAADAVQHPPPPVAPKPGPLAVLSTLPVDAVVAGTAHLEVQIPGRQVDHVDFAVDGTGVHSEQQAPYEVDLDTLALADGPHQLAVNVVFSGGGYAIAVWSIAVANAPGAVLTPPAPPTAVPIAKSSLPPPAPPEPTVQHALYRAGAPAQPVTIKQLDAALVAYLGLNGAAREIQLALQGAGLQPPANTGTEAVARMLHLRLNHPSGQDDLELLPFQPATRAEAAWSFAQVLRLDQWAVDSVQHAADAFTLPELTTRQRQVLTTAVHYVGYPYVWGGTSPTAETLYGVRAAGGFDCSGYVWRVYKLTPYPAAPRLSGVLRGRTTYQMSGEVPHRELIPAVKLQPADVMFFGAHGRGSKPSEVDHTALYLGNGWFIQSSGEGVTLLPF